MAEFPALPLWTDAYLADTRHLSQAEHGAYLLLLMTAWRTPDCSLPDDDRLLARYACCDMRTWRRQRLTVMAFWTLRDGRWRQKRLSAERAYVAEMHCKRAEAGSRGGRASAASKVLKCKDAPQAGLNDCSSKIQAPTPTPIISERDKSLSAGKPAPDPEKPLYDLGREVLGRGYGGIVKQLIRHHGGDRDAATRTLERARRKANPREYVMAILRGAGGARAEDVLAETDRLYRQLGVS